MWDARLAASVDTKSVVRADDESAMISRVVMIAALRG
jgi:hypothetical protein